ncbi:hypothetical protein DXG01_005638 [Tephrocybe rancida]|nr:hypothetical protein DXG01_005638 [Tephrocybe rancida]
MSVNNIIRFHREVADASPIPVMIYNFPVVTAGQDLDSDTLATLTQHPNIVGTKLSCGNIRKLHHLATRFPSSEFAVYAGRSDFFTQGLLSGSAGTIAALEGKVVEAMELQGKFTHADWAIGKIGGIGGVKAIVSKNFGYGSTTVRGPLKAVDAERLHENKHYKAMEEMISVEKAL